LAGRPKNELREEAILLRRERVLELTAKGYGQRQIANMLSVSHATVGFDQQYLKQQAKQNIQNYVDERLPEEYEKCLVGINEINREAWTIAQDAEDNREKISALTLAKECYSMKLDLLTNAELVSNAAKFVEKHKQSDKDNKNNNDSSNTSVQSSTQIGNDIGNDKEPPTTNEVF
jgi:predicted transcriptional regulator